MTYYRNKKQKLKELDEAVNKERILNAKSKDYDMGIVPQTLDNRTTYEKLNDDVYMYQILREKVYDLFNNDSQTSEKYLELLQNKNIKQEDFINVYSDLKARYKGQIATPANVLSTTKNLINNFNETGNTTSFNASEILLALSNFRNNILPQINISPKKEKDIEEKLDAIEFIVDDYDEFLSEEDNIKKKATAELRNIILSILYYDGDSEKDIISSLTRTTTAIFKQFAKENDFKTQNEVMRDSFIGASDIKELNSNMKNEIDKYNDILNELNELKGKPLNGGQQKKYNKLVKKMQIIQIKINELQSEIDRIEK